MELARAYGGSQRKPGQPRWRRARRPSWPRRCERELSAWSSVLFCSCRPCARLDPRSFTRSSQPSESTLPKFHEVYKSRTPQWLPDCSAETGGLPCTRTRHSHVEHAPISVEHRFLHHLGQGRMREDRVHQLFLSGLEIHRDHVALDQLGHLGADHVCAE